MYDWYAFCMVNLVILIEESSRKTLFWITWINSCHKLLLYCFFIMHVFVIMVFSAWDRPMIFLLFCLSLVLYEIFAPYCVLVVCGSLISSEICAPNCVFDWVRIYHFLRLFIFIFSLCSWAVFYPFVFFFIFWGFLIYFCVYFNHFCVNLIYGSSLSKDLWFKCS